MKCTIPDKPFQVVSTDLIGPLETTLEGNKYILVLTDYLTHYAEIKAMPNKKADTVAKFLWEIFCEHGVPQVMYSDSGCEFRNSVLTEMAKNIHLKHVKVAVYHPASNGLTERKNASIIEVLRCFKGEKDWDMCLHTAKLAVNGAYNVSLGDSPYYLYKHQDVELPITRFMKPRFTYEETLPLKRRGNEGNTWSYKR